MPDGIEINTMRLLEKRGGSPRQFRNLEMTSSKYQNVTNQITRHNVTNVTKLTKLLIPLLPLIPLIPLIPLVPLVPLI